MNKCGVNKPISDWIWVYQWKQRRITFLWSASLKSLAMRLLLSPNLTIRPEFVHCFLYHFLLPTSGSIRNHSKSLPCFEKSKTQTNQQLALQYQKAHFPSCFESIPQDNSMKKSNFFYKILFRCLPKRKIRILSTTW